jgi:hypothetical protein
MARLVKERMSINTDPEKISLDDLVNARTFRRSSRRSSDRRSCHSSWTRRIRSPS